MENDIYLSVIFPAYNEEKRIPKTLEIVNEYMIKQPYTYEIIVIIDGAKDNTSGVLNAMKDRIKNLRIIDNKQNHGKGYVVRQAMLEAKGELRLFSDSDNSTSIDQVEKIIAEHKKGEKVIIGSRDIEGAKKDPPQPWYRTLLGDGFTLIVNTILGLWGIPDTQCGFKAMTSSATQDIMRSCTIDRFAFDPEILVIAKKRGYNIKQIPVHWVDDLQSTVKFSSIFNMFKDVLKIKLNDIKGVYDKKD